ncbi:probable RNA-binding protein 46 [Condylostylus longicornis]|uniref:probable RNA-binding protein 46 n=1 Tax=Condylostylus longicornis TaxID=2530218 RepID=UPI00244E1E24|nr:probable RNA-binding protein 46 [Condylostylus longicornis]
MQNFTDFNFLELFQNLNISESDLTINGFSYPIYQENGQRAVGPVYKNGQKIKGPKRYENEIFIDKIPCSWSENNLMNLLMKAGVVYFLRFLVNFSGQSRGIAYVQYLGDTPPYIIVGKLNHVFRITGIKIYAQISKNYRRLKIGNILPKIQDEKISIILQQFECIESYSVIRENKKKSCILSFGNNRQACLARRVLLSQSSIFGPSSYVVWFDKPKNNVM